MTSLHDHIKYIEKSISEGKVFTLFEYIKKNYSAEWDEDYCLRQFTHMYKFDLSIDTCRIIYEMAMVRFMGRCKHIINMEATRNGK